MRQVKIYVHRWPAPRAADIRFTQTLSPSSPGVERSIRSTFPAQLCAYCGRVSLFRKLIYAANHGYPKAQATQVPIWCCLQFALPNVDDTRRDTTAVPHISCGYGLSAQPSGVDIFKFHDQKDLHKIPQCSPRIAERKQGRLHCWVLHRRSCKHVHLSALLIACSSTPNS